MLSAIPRFALNNVGAFLSFQQLSDVDQMIFETLPFAIHIRSVASDQYLSANLLYARQLGFQKPEDILHTTYTYIANYRKQRIETLNGDLNLEASYQTLLHEANLQAIHTKKPYRFTSCTLLPTGFIYIGDIQKIPLLDTHQNVHSVLTVSKDITNRSELIELYGLYKKHYECSKQSIGQFMRYLKISHLFNVLPTHRELMTLLTFRKDARAKYVARQLTLSDRTVEEYKARLRHKLKHPLTLEALLLKLRHPQHTLFERVSN